MKITAVSADCYRVPVKLPLLDEPVVQTIVIARVDAGSDLVGHGLAGAPGMAIATREFINQQVAPALVGMDPLRHEKVWAYLLEKFNRRALGGVWSMGVSAIDLALWDLKGKKHGVSVSEFLGGRYKEVPAYVTFGVPEYTREQLAQVARMMVEQGHKTLKMVVAVPRGSADAGSTETARARTMWEQAEEDAERVRVVREAVGPSIGLMMDANCLFTLAEAKHLTSLVERYNISWIEEPIRRNDPLAMAELRQHTTIPIAAGQNISNAWDHRELIVNRAVDIPQPNVCHVGGLTEALRVANLAHAFNLDIGHGGRWPYHNVHLHGAVPNGGFIEFHLAAWETMNILFEDVPTNQNGYVPVPQQPGFGFEPRKEALDEYRVPR
jgi:L-alanine-DL-glutamate epimerase-like enolase superfamily enzyme